MDPITIIAMSNAVIALVEKTLPVLRDAFKGGEISVEEQAQVRANYERLRQAGGDAFSGPEWELSGR